MKEIYIVILITEDTSEMCPNSQRTIQGVYDDSEKAYDLKEALEDEFKHYLYIHPEHSFIKEHAIVETHKLNTRL